MKKRLGILLAITVICAMALTLVACDKKDAEGRIILKTPQDVAINGDTLSWSVVNNADGYIVKMGDTVITSEIPKSKTTYAIPADLSSGEFSVAAKGDGKKYADGAFSSAVSFVRTSQLVAPSGITIDYNAKTVSWSAVEDAASYKVYIKAQGQSSDKENEYSVTEGTSYSLASLSDEPEIYEICVQAISGATNIKDSGRSGIKNYIISAVLATPQNLEFVEASKNLRWGSVDNAVRYRIEAYKVEGDAETIYSYYEPTGTSTAISNLKINDAGKYRFKVKAIGNTSGTYLDSALSTGTVETIKLALPTGISFDGETLSWAQYSDSLITDQEVRITVRFNSGKTSFEKAIELIETTSLTMESVSEFATDSYIGQIYDIYIKATGNGTTVLDSAEVKADYSDGYLSYKTTMTTAEDGYYEINNAGELGYAVNNPTSNYRLMANINLASSDWRILGGTDAFTGIFDGNGFVISNLTIGNRNSGATNVGFFASIASGGVVKNLSILNCEIRGGDNSGIIAGQNAGNIENCNVSGKIISSGAKAGGITAVNSGNIKYSFSNTHIISGNAGGIAAENNGAITNCGAYNIISSSLVVSGGGTELCAGGLVGLNNGTIDDSFAQVAVSANSTGTNAITYVGGFVGKNTAGGTIKNSYATKNFSALSVGANSQSYSGGFVGYNLGNITDAYAVGSMTEDNNGYSGGFVGGNASGATIKNAFARGSMSGSVSRSGFFAGENMGTLTNTYHQRGMNYNACAVGDGSAVTVIERAAFKTEATAQKLGSAFIYHDVSQSKYPVLASMIYIGEAESVTISQNRGVSYTFKDVYFGGETVAATKVPATDVTGEFIVEFEKTVGDRTYKTIKFFTVK